jgi:hypothetical protein
MISRILNLNLEVVSCGRRNPLPLLPLPGKERYFSLLLRSSRRGLVVWYKSVVRISNSRPAWCSRLQGLNIPLGGLVLHLAAWYLSWLCPGILVSTCDHPTECHPSSKRWMNTSRPESLPVQPQVIMGSGLVYLSCDSSWPVLRDVEEQ